MLVRNRVSTRVSLHVLRGRCVSERRMLLAGVTWPLPGAQTRQYSSGGMLASSHKMMQSWAANRGRPWMCVNKECRAVSKGAVEFCEACGSKKPVLNGWMCTDCNTRNFGGVKVCKMCKEPFSKSSEFWMCIVCEKNNRIDEIEDNSRCGFCGYDMAPPSVAEEELIRRGHEMFEESRRAQEQFDSITPQEADEQFGNVCAGAESVTSTNKLPLGLGAKAGPAIPKEVKPFEPSARASLKSRLSFKRQPLPSDSIPPGPPGFDWMCRQPDCGHINPGDEEVCMKCQEHIQPTEWECPFCAAINHLSRSKCFNCMQSIPISWKCFECKMSTSIYDKQCRSCSLQRPPAEPKLPREAVHTGGVTQQRNSKRGDWLCSACNGLNFGFRTECFQCSSPRTEASQSVSGGDAWSQSSGGHNNWFCPQCQATNFRTRGECWQCGTPNQEASFGEWSSDSTPKFEHEGFQDGDAKPAEGAMNSWRKNDDWACAKCFAKNFKSRNECFKCGAPRMAAVVRKSPIRKPVKL